MRSPRSFHLALSLLFAGLCVWSASGGPPAFAQTDAMQAQMQTLQATSQIQDPQERAGVLEAFIEKYPDTPFKADVYSMLFNSYRQFSQDHDHVWTLGVQFLEELTIIAEAKAQPAMRNPLLANAYNSVAYEFSERGAYLDEALGYAQQALSLIHEAAMTRPPTMPEDQWKAQIDYLRGQILDTLGWVQFKRKAYPDAEKAIRDALALIPDNGTVHFHLGRVYTVTGQEDKAVNAYLMAATAETPDKEAAGALQQIFNRRHGGDGGAQLESAMAAARVRTAEQAKQRILASRMNMDAGNPTFARLDGTPVSLADLKGKVVVINFWATWCPPCREEMPALQKVWSSYRDKTVAFIIASVDQEQDKIQPYIDRHGYAFPVYLGHEAAQQYMVQSIPTTLVIDPDGMVQYKHIGYRPDIEQVLGWQIDALMR